MVSGSAAASRISAPIVANCALQSVSGDWHVSCSLSHRLIHTMETNMRLLRSMMFMMITTGVVGLALTVYALGG